MVRADMTGHGGRERDPSPWTKSECCGVRAGEGTDATVFPGAQAVLREPR